MASSRTRGSGSASGQPRAAPLPRGITGHLKGWLNVDGEFLVGPRYIQLLEGIERTGTIRAGCQATRMSYRTCLNRIQRMERALGTPLVTTRRGGRDRGRAELTEPARRLIRLYRGWRDRLEKASTRAFGQALRSRARP